jgi:exosortase A-associated hydrolase 1
MRRLLTVDCEGSALGASLDGPIGATGLLIVTGGTQTRIGSHRLFERLAFALAQEGIACFRFDRRGVGDGEGEDPGWRGSGPDIEAAAATFRREAPGLERIFGFGLCDGASALALHGAGAGLAGLILVNPWLVEAEAGEPPAAAVASHYRRQLASLSGWKRMISGSISYRKLLTGVSRIFARQPSSLSGEIAGAIDQARLPVRLILARGDATATAAEAEWRSEPFRKLRLPPPVFIESDSHTFARPGDFDALRVACIQALGAYCGKVVP